jgi:hypothetical protein
MNMLYVLARKYGFALQFGPTAVDKLLKPFAKPQHLGVSAPKDHNGSEDTA